MKTILCIGAGYVGGPTMAMIARQCPEHKVIVADVNAKRIRAWESDELPIYEPGLLPLVQASRGRNLCFTTAIPQAIREADIIFVSVNTPTKDYGQGAGMAADLQYWEKVAREILAHSDRDKIVVEKSTLPVRTAEAMARILNVPGAPVHFEILSNPEFLAEGTAVRDLEQPDRVLVGGNLATARGRQAVAELAEIYAHWVPQERILTTNVWSSELSKLVANAFLAQRVSSINSISALAEATGADVREVARAVGMDSRIGPKFLQAGIGFGGSCFKKDILNLVYLCRHYGLDAVADYWLSVVAINEWQQTRFVRRMLTAMFNTIAGKRIAIFGFAFKADTGDTREAPALTVCRQLLAERAELAITDPAALENARADLGADAERVAFEPDPYRAAAGAHALVFLTDWRQYRELDFQRLHAGMVRPAFLFDGRNFLDHEALHRLGFNVYPIGRPELTHLAGGLE
ncbi:MAG: nucleotide sugar dehydrogenase [Lentisphaeria bacterium]|jgi:UDPglucose 6-dehydrogenase